jgi:hypothetical protein
MDYDTWGGCRTENDVPVGSVGWYNGTASPIDALPGCVGVDIPCTGAHTLLKIIHASAELAMDKWSEARVYVSEVGKNKIPDETGAITRWASPTESELVQAVSRNCLSLRH